MTARTIKAVLEVLVLACALTASIKLGLAQQPRAAVILRGFTFKPSTLSVRVGTTVTFTNDDDEPHSVVASDGSFNSQALDPGKSFSITFNKSGTVMFFCGSHQFMEGRVIVNSGELAGNR